MKIQILGPGCPNCKKLHQAVLAVVKKLDYDIEVEYSTDIAQLVELGAMSSPAFVIDGKLITSGKIPSHECIEKMIVANMEGDNQNKNESQNEGGCACQGKC